MADILVIDDDESICYSLSRLIRRLGHEATSASTISDGLEKLPSKSFDLVFLDVRMPDGNGLDLLPRIQEICSRPEVIIMTGFGDPDGAELAIKSGAWDYIEKGASSKDILLSLTRAIEYRKEKLCGAHPGTVTVLEREGIIGAGPAIRSCLELVAQAAQSDAGVLVTGETGTGKELIAQAIHRNSARASRDFVVVDCAALPESLVESHLFGHDKGAFTGAEKSRPGLVLQAHGGTLFLDEVGELPLSLQKAFLRVLQEHRFRPLGSRREVESDFRLVAATNRDLDRMAQDGQFRSDLLFRLRSFVIELPPLRRHPEDIPDLVRHHVDRICRHGGLASKGLSPGFVETLAAYNWPGNVRELVNALDRAIAVARFEPTLYVKHLPTDIRARIARTQVGRDVPSVSEEAGKKAILPSELPVFRDYREAAIDQAEKQYLHELVSLCGRNIKEACRLSGLSQSRLYALMQKHGVSTQR